MNQLVRTSNQLDPSKLAGRLITHAELDAENDKLFLTFENGLRVVIFDDGQQCCESRHMSTDDDISSLIGARLIHIDGRDGAEIGDIYETHDTCFVEIQTDKGLVTLVNHNEHNGYYGGFDMTIRQVS